MSCIKTALFGALSAAVLLWAPQSLAVGPITPTYLACQAQMAVLGKVCTGSETIISGAAPSTAGYISSLIGYVNTTDVAGTEPAYLACQAGTSILGPTCLKKYQIITGAAPNPSLYISSFIGYVYTSQVAGSQPTYLACLSVATITGPACAAPAPNASQYTIIRGAAPSNAYLSWFIGYVFPTIPISSYTAYPKYYVGSVVYVPPGPGSSIQYGTGTVTGTTLSMTDSFSGTSTAGASEGTPKGSGTINANVTFSLEDGFGGSTMNSTDVEITNNSTEKYQAPMSNALNHDYDQIILFFGVRVIETVNYYGAITWAVDFSALKNTNDAASGYPVAVGCLRANSTIPAAQCADTLAFLASNSITAADYPNIIGADPFANPSGSQVPASSRFKKLDAFSFFGDPTTVTYTYMVNNSTTVMNSVTTSYSYKEGFSGSLYGLSFGSSITFTDSSTTSNKTTSSDTSMLSLTMPTTTYTGPSTLNVYEDTIYKTFMFSFD
jgi:hypothetical protein